VLTREGSIADLFMELVAVPSPSGRERVLGEQIRDWLADAGVAADFDGTGAGNDSDAGNLIAVVDGPAGAPAYLFVAHMDTVETGSPAVRPHLDGDGVIRSAGDTILGADNKSAVAAVMRLCAAVAARPVPARPTVIAVFTCREESGTMGVSLLDLPVRVDCAFCVDGSQPVGTVITRALGQTVFSFTVHGRTAHAAANPEAGISAIRVASAIVADLPLGRLPGGGSASIAAIVGGAVIDRLSPAGLWNLRVDPEADGPTSVRAALQRTPTNSVPQLALVRGEVRGYSIEEMETMVQAIADTVARVCAARGATYDWVRDADRMIPPFPGAAGSRALELVHAAAGSVAGVRFVREEAQATLEANYLAATTDVVAVASGGRNPHQLSETITVAELQQLEALLLAIVDAGVWGLKPPIPA
jgi:acetylornithine deacetylase/succinyl-diaminopimelate desuccinylase-like protein